jgi:hypothetical protein
MSSMRTYNAAVFHIQSTVVLNTENPIKTGFHMKKNAVRYAKTGVKNTEKHSFLGTKISNLLQNWVIILTICEVCYIGVLSNIRNISSNIQGK